MDPITIVLALLVAGAFIFLDNAFDRLLRPVLRAFGLSASAGPMVCRGNPGEGCFELKVDNQGKTKTSIAAVSIVGAQGKKAYPVLFTTEGAAVAWDGQKGDGEVQRRLAADRFGQGESRTIYLSLQELEGCSLASLAVMDAHGGSWPVSSGG